MRGGPQGLHRERVPRTGLLVCFRRTRPGQLLSGAGHPRDGRAASARPRAHAPAPPPARRDRRPAPGRQGRSARNVSGNPPTAVSTGTHAVPERPRASTPEFSIARYGRHDHRRPRERRREPRRPTRTADPRDPSRRPPSAAARSRSGSIGMRGLPTTSSRTPGTCATSAAAPRPARRAPCPAAAARRTARARRRPGHRPRRERGRRRTRGGAITTRGGIHADLVEQPRAAVLGVRDHPVAGAVQGAPARNRVRAPARQHVVRREHRAAGRAGDPAQRGAVELRERRPLPVHDVGRVRRARTTSEASPAAWPASFRGALIGLRGRARTRP